MNGRAGDLAWETRGDPKAPPILLVRPLGGSMRLWGDFADALARELHVVAFDARGTGASAGTARSSTRALAKDGAGLLDCLSIDRLHLFGISLGGMVATHLAADLGPRVRSLVLASTALRGLAFERAGLLRGLRFARCLARPPASMEACLVERVLSHGFRRDRPDRAARLLELARATPSPRRSIALHAIAAARHDATRHGVASHILAPTLVLAGDRDHLLGEAPPRALAGALPHASFEAIAGAGHDLTLEAPAETARRVLAFVHAADSGSH